MITVVSALFYGDERNLHPPQPQPLFEGVEYKLITNKPELAKDTMWEATYVEPQKGLRLEARKVKSLIHTYFPDSKFWIWIDNSMQIKVDPKLLIAKYHHPYNITTFPHSERNNIVEEFEILYKWQPKQMKDTNPFLIQKYMEEGYIPMSLYTTNVIIRSNIPKVTNFNELWWDQISNHCIRDQISFPYVGWKTGNYINTFPGSNFDTPLAKASKPWMPLFSDIKMVN